MFAHLNETDMLQGFPINILQTTRSTIYNEVSKDHYNLPVISQGFRYSWVDVPRHSLLQPTRPNASSHYRIPQDRINSCWLAPQNWPHLAESKNLKKIQELFGDVLELIIYTPPCLPPPDLSEIGIYAIQKQNIDSLNPWMFLFFLSHWWKVCLCNAFQIVPSPVGRRSCERSISNFAKKIMSQMLFHTLFVYFVHFVHGMKNNPFDRFMVTICYNMFQSS